MTLSIPIVVTIRHVQLLIMESGLTPPFSAPGIVNGVFEWQTSCNHINAILGCGATTSTFTFLVKVHDDFVQHLV